MSTERLKVGNIRLLPPQLANQIAAGEVVERPASVVKELIENSIDAKADSIHIEIDQGGHKRILIRDTGSGIEQDQLELALSRHATSKINDIDDLESITSMGFRGEALASISSVSRLTLTSRPTHQPQAWQAKAEGIDMKVSLTPAAHPNGTSIEVVDIFFNTPARRKFLRAQKTEFQHIEGIVRRIALAHPAIAFSLKHNNKIVHKWAAGDLTARVTAICGSTYLQQTTPIDYQHDQIHLTGWCSKMGAGWQTNDQQYIFVNQRMVKDKLILHAIRQAYEGMLPDNQHPAYVLFLSVPARQMDINVHPAKHEVRFHNARQVHDVIFQAIGQAIVTAQALAEQSEHDASAKSLQSGVSEREQLIHLASQTPNHNYIRPLESKGTDHNPVSGGFDVNDISARARMQSTTSRVAPRKPSAKGFGEAGEASVAESGKRYQELMQTSIPNDNQLIAFVRLGDYLLFQEPKRLIALPLSTIMALSIEQDISRASTSQPLLMPVSIAQQTVSQQSVINLLEAIGCSIELRYQKYILKQVPSAIRALPWVHIFGCLLEQSEPIETESDCLVQIAKCYLNVMQLSHLNLQNIVSRLPKDKLLAAIHDSGLAITENMLMTLMDVQ